MLGLVKVVWPDFRVYDLASGVWPSFRGMAWFQGHSLFQGV